MNEKRKEEIFLISAFEGINHGVKMIWLLFLITIIQLFGGLYILVFYEN
jgi:hypothetical protein